ncbi:MAG: hypothetical protein K2W94_00025 [Alphaproteobacteria bacterium]|nr:hypothetical protein [Alphaproteobacteria bacterium]
MPIIAVQCPAHLPVDLLRTSNEENSLDILCTLYDLYDAKRWVTKFISKHKDANFCEMIVDFQKISEKLTDLIKHYTFLMNEIMKEKSLEVQYSLEQEIENWP